MRVPLQEIIRKLPVTSPLHQTKNSLDIRKHLRQAKKALHDIRVQDWEQQNQYLEHKSLHYRILDKQKQAKNFQSMHKAELMPYIYKKSAPSLTQRHFKLWILSIFKLQKEPKE